MRHRLHLTFYADYVGHLSCCRCSYLTLSKPIIPVEEMVEMSGIEPESKVPSVQRIYNHRMYFYTQVYLYVIVFKSQSISFYILFQDLMVHYILHQIQEHLHTQVNLQILNLDIHHMIKLSVGENHHTHAFHHL